MPSTAFTSSTSAAGSGSAASLTLEEWGTLEFDVFYDVAVTGNIHVEVSEDGGTTWRHFDTISIGSGGAATTYQAHTAFADVRVYADSADYADADVNAIVMSARVTRS